MLARFLRDALRFTMRVTVALVLMGVIDSIPWPEADRGTIALVLSGALAAVVTILVGVLLYDTFYPGTTQPEVAVEGGNARPRPSSRAPADWEDGQ